MCFDFETRPPELLYLIFDHYGINMAHNCYYSRVLRKFHSVAVLVYMDRNTLLIFIGQNM